MVRVVCRVNFVGIEETKDLMQMSCLEETRDQLTKASSDRCYGYVL